MGGIIYCLNCWSFLLAPFFYLLLLLEFYFYRHRAQVELSVSSFFFVSSLIVCIYTLRKKMVRRYVRLTDLFFDRIKYWFSDISFTYRYNSSFMVHISIFSYSSKVSIISYRTFQRGEIKKKKIQQLRSNKRIENSLSRSKCIINRLRKDQRNEYGCMYL